MKKLVKLTALYTDGTQHEVEITVPNRWHVSTAIARYGSVARRTNPDLACLYMQGYRWVGHYTHEHMAAINRYLSP